MLALIEQDLAATSHRIWLYDRSHGGVNVLRLTDQFCEWEAVPRGVASWEIKPTFVLPDGALEALLAGANEIVKSNDATVDALHDTRQVRDRMITLVEKLIAEPPVQTKEG